MSRASNQIECPNCGHDIDVNEILYHQVDEQLKKKYNDELAQQRSEFQGRLGELKTEREKLEVDKSELDAKVNETIKQRLSAETKRLRTTIKLEFETAQSEELKTLRQEIGEKATQLKDFKDKIKCGARCFRDRSFIRWIF